MRLPRQPQPQYKKTAPAAGVGLDRPAYAVVHSRNYDFDSTTMRANGRTMTCAVLNALCLCTSTWGLWRATEVRLPASLAGAGHRQFLTILAVVATIITNVANLGALAAGGARARRAARQVALPVALVVETVVAVVYWPLRLFALPLIMHDVKDGSRMPLAVSVDCAVHLAPVVLLGADYALVEQRPFEMSLGRAWVVVTALGLGYRRYLETMVDRAGGAAYPYPFLAVAEPYQSGIFVVVTTAAWAVFWGYKRVHAGRASGRT